MEAKRGTRNGILSLAIKDKAVLYAAYMPFVRNGGLFIPTKKEYELGDEVFMLLNLMDEAEKIPVAGKVVWMTPKGAQGNRAAGIGVQFNDQDDVARTQDRDLPRRRAAIGPPHAHDVGVLVDSHCHLNYLARLRRQAGVGARGRCSRLPVYRRRTAESRRRHRHRASVIPMSGPAPGCIRRASTRRWSIDWVERRVAP